ncbi:hypothetical protein ACE1CD_34595 [Aerosakkonema sp. BLCC-F183]|uniref:hypothetical protein n=1 Tax=Aerosakkonema sp. BLCC-F183 TaxID=3342834 RepID=UPI0035BA6173
MTLSKETLLSEFTEETGDTSNTDFDNLLTDFVEIEDPQGLTDNVQDEISSLDKLDETIVETDFKNEAIAYDLMEIYDDTSTTNAIAYDLHEIYATKTTNATHTYGDFISNFHDFMNFQLHSIPKPTDAGELLNDYNDLEQRVDVDQSQSDESVIIAEAAHEVADLFALDADSTTTKLLADYAEWVKPADILLEAKTQGIDDKGNLVLDWWTLDHCNSWSQAYLNKYKGVWGWKHEGMEVEYDHENQIINVNGAVDEITNSTIADGTGNVVKLSSGVTDTGDTSTSWMLKSRHQKTSIEVYIGSSKEISNWEGMINKWKKDEEVDSVKWKIVYESALRCGGKEENQTFLNHFEEMVELINEDRGGAEVGTCDVDDDLPGVLGYGYEGNPHGLLTPVATTIIQLA